MILSALADYYQQLRREYPDEIASPGWSTCKVSFLLALSPEGELMNIIPAEDKAGWIKQVPERVKRASGIAANAFCDNATYFLGIDNKGKPERSSKCFEACKDLHLSVLAGVDSPQANAVRGFFNGWNPKHAQDNQVVIEAGPELLKGGNLVFVLEGKDVLEDAAICEAWERYVTAPSDDSVVMRCLVTGERAPIARLHPAIKGLYGAQAVASLVGFNARAFESYGHTEEQGLNAPVSEQAAFAYSTALNYLLSEPSHHVRIGDTTVVYWASRDDEAASEVVSYLLGNLPRGGAQPSGKSDAQTVDATIDSIMTSLSAGKLSDLGGLDPDARFFVLGLAPSAARISVRFFVQDSFGDMMGNLQRHYGRIQIAGASLGQKYLSPWRLVMETENPKSKNTTSASELGGALMRAILTNGPYPEALYKGALLRIKATQDDTEKHIRKVSRGRAAIIKACLIKNRADMYEEGTMECLDESREEVPYLLGRLFCRLEDMQRQARLIDKKDKSSKDLGSTIKDKYFNAACATPALVFPMLLQLAEKHASKVRRNKHEAAAAGYETFVRGILSRIDSFPTQLSSSEQGDFILGYYHQQSHDIDVRVKAKQERERAKGALE